MTEPHVKPCIYCGRNLYLMPKSQRVGDRCRRCYDRATRGDSTMEVRFPISEKEED